MIIAWSSGYRWAFVGRGATHRQIARVVSLVAFHARVLARPGRALVFYAVLGGPRPARLSANLIPPTFATVPAHRLLEWRSMRRSTQSNIWHFPPIVPLPAS
jgi:hypothetical protein